MYFIEYLDCQHKTTHKSTLSNKNEFQDWLNNNYYNIIEHFKNEESGNYLNVSSNTNNDNDSEKIKIENFYQFMKFLNYNKRKLIKNAKKFFQHRYYLSADIYKNGKEDYSNGGLSSNHNDVIMFKTDLSTEKIIKIIINDNLNIEKCVQAIKRDYINYVHFEPISYFINIEDFKKSIITINKTSSCHGGCYIKTSDSRYKEYTFNIQYPLSLHDRVFEYNNC